VEGINVVEIIGIGGRTTKVCEMAGRINLAPSAFGEVLQTEPSGVHQSLKGKGGVTRDTGIGNGEGGKTARGKESGGSVTGHANFRDVVVAKPMAGLRPAIPARFEKKVSVT